MNVPTRRDCIDALARVLGADGAARAWERACSEASVSAQAELSLELLERAVERLAKQPGLASVVGCSLVIRVRSAALLIKERGEGK